MIQKQIKNICDKFFSEYKPHEQIGKLAIVRDGENLKFYHYHMLVMVWNEPLKKVIITDRECKTDLVIQRNYLEYLTTYR
jgi:hypothetical protein